MINDLKKEINDISSLRLDLEKKIESCLEKVKFDETK